MNADARVIVGTKAGKVVGVRLDRISIFKGIPYAAPPVGELRWMPPAPVQPWDGTRSALEFGPIAPQVRTSSLLGSGPAEPQSEDCLYLNIWTPGADDALRPVLVWIHGGVFNLGSGSQASYDGSLLAANRDVVVVTINYRLGMLGFLNLKEVTGGRIPATGNEGLLDQMAALTWVRDNIAAFGGDPGSVTVFGESAGAMSVACLLAMPAAKGLFHKAILESGVGNTAIPLEAALDVSRAFLDLAGISGDDPSGLRALTPEKLVACDVELRARLAGPGQPPRHGVTAPVIDFDTLPVVPLEAIRKGSAAGTPLLIGTNLDEWRFFGAMTPGFPNVAESDITRFLRPYVPAEYAPAIVDVYKNARMQRGDGVSPMELVSATLSDCMFRIRALHVVEAQESIGSPVFNYLFTWKTAAMNGLLGACHLAELGFVFGTHDAAFAGSGPDADALSARMQEAWTTFARTGKPGGSGIGPWPPFGERRTTMIIDRQWRIEEAPYEEERRAWGMVPGSDDR